MRHGEVHNPRAIFYGRMPRFRLSEAGRRQAEAAADYLAGAPLAAIYTSPLLRARQTAAIIQRAQQEAGRRVPAKVLSWLLEVRIGR